MEASSLLKVKVKPRSREESVEEFNGELIVRLTKSPVDGEANKELIKVLSKHFKVPGSEIKIVKGLSSRNKLVRIT